MDGQTYDAGAELRIRETTANHPDTESTELNIVARLGGDSAVTLRLYGATDLREDLLGRRTVKGQLSLDQSYVGMNVTEDQQAFISDAILEEGRPAGEYTLDFSRRGALSGSFDAETAQPDTPENQHRIAATFRGPMAVTCWYKLAEDHRRQDPRFESDFCAPFKEEAQR